MSDIFDRPPLGQLSKVINPSKEPLNGPRRDRLWGGQRAPRARPPVNRVVPEAGGATRRPPADPTFWINFDPGTASNDDWWLPTQAG